MLLMTLVRALRANWKQTLTAVVLLPVPLLMVTFLGSRLFSQSPRALTSADPSVDLALLVEPSVAGTNSPSTAKNGEGIETLLNWKYTPLTTGS